jgi:hypothetical protein
MKSHIWGFLLFTLSVVASPLARAHRRSLRIPIVLSDEDHGSRGSRMVRR